MISRYRLVFSLEKKDIYSNELWLERLARFCKDCYSAGAEMNFYFDLVSYNAKNKRFLSRCTLYMSIYQEKNTSSMYLNIYI